MNVYDSHRMADTLAPEGFVESAIEDADLVILNTCHIREKAAEKIYSELGRVNRLKQEAARDGRRVMVAVAGCVAQAEGEEIIRRAPVVDIVVGPHYPRLPQKEAEGYAGRVYTRDAHVPTGTVLANWDKLNGLFDKERCFAHNPQPFDLWLGIAGGGDTLFFRQLIRAGRKIVWCAEGLIHETIPPERLTPRYVFRRRFHHGQITTFVRMAVKPAQPLGMTFWMAVGCAQVVCYAPVSLVLRALNDERWVAAMGQCIGGLGKVLWHPKLHLRLYR